MDDKYVSPVGRDVHPLGFVASETSLCDELETSVAHCLRTGQMLVVHSSKAVELARDLSDQHPELKVMADTGAWRREPASGSGPLADVDTLFGLDGWCSLNFPVDSGLSAYAPARFVPAEDRAGRQELLAATRDLPPNIQTLVPTDAAVLDAKRRDAFFDDLEGTAERPFTFVFADRANPMGRYQRLVGMRQLLKRHPGSGIVQVDPLVAADALAHGAGWVAVGASSSRRLPGRPSDPSGGRMAAGFLPGLFLLELLSFAVRRSTRTGSRTPGPRTARRVAARWTSSSPIPPTRRRSSRTTCTRPPTTSTRYSLSRLTSALYG